MTRQQILPCTIMVISIGAACIYLYHGDVRRALYWAAGAVITATVTF